MGSATAEAKLPAKPGPLPRFTWPLRFKSFKQDSMPEPSNPAWNLYFCIEAESVRVPEAKYSVFKQEIETIVNSAARAEPVGTTPLEYVPSDELVNLVRESIERDWLEQSNRRSENQTGLEPPPMMGEEFRNQYALNDSIRKSVASAVVNFLTTIGRGLARGQESVFPLTANGALTEEVLRGFVFRIPVGLHYLNSFSKYIYKDLIRSAAHRTLDSQYAKLDVTANDLVLSRTKTVEKPQKSGWKKATVFIPE